MVLGDYIQETPQQLGYTKFEEYSCSSTVERGRALDRKRKNYNVMSAQLIKEKEQLKKNGHTQQSYENLEAGFQKSLLEKTKLETLLQTETTLTKAMKKSPELYYQQYVANGGQLGSWFSRTFKKVTGSISNSLTFGHSCGGAEREFKRDQRAYDTARKRYTDLLKEKEVLADIDKKSKAFILEKRDPLNKEIENLKKQIAEQKEQRKAIMVTYEAKKRAEELALKQEAERKKKEALTGGKNKKYLIGGALLLGTVLLLNSGKSKKKKK